MPSLVTHIWCAKEARELWLAAEGRRESYGALSQGALFLGAQAGDIFFYEGLLPYPGGGKKIPSPIGSIMHEEGMRRLILTLLDLAFPDSPGISEGGRAQGDESVGAFGDFGNLGNSGNFGNFGNLSSEERILLSYTLGYISHYVLDSTAHPYVYARAGRPGVQSSKREIYEANCRHYELEKKIDLLFLPDAAKVEVDRLITLTDDEEKLLLPFLSEAIKRCYPMQGEIPVAHIKKAIRDMQGVYRVLRDPGGWKRKLFRLLDNPYFPLGHLHTNIYPKIETQTTSGVGSTAFLDDVQDFLPVYRTALMRTLELWEAVDGYLRGIISKEQLGQLLGNKSFTTGEEVPDPIT